MDMASSSPPRSSRSLSRLVAGGALVAATGVQGVALGLPAEGERAPNARVEDADGRALEMKSLQGKPVIIMYEDKESSSQNKAFKDELGKLAKGDRYKKTVALAAIADVSGYNFWPAKGFVKDAIREESVKAGTTIYCDWDGSFRKKYRLRAGVSSVLLVSRAGEVLFAAEGTLTAERRGQIIELLKSEIAR